MAITKEEIKKLSHLARIELSESEVESLAQEVDSILGYVSQIQDFSGEEKGGVPALHNVLREDVPTHKAEEYTEDILNVAPTRDGKYLSVKKILG